MSHTTTCISEANARVWHEGLCADDASKSDIAALAMHFLATDEDDVWCTCSFYAGDDE